MTTPSPSWDDLRLLLAVVETGSLARAASATGSSVQTLSRRLKQLEAELGGGLFLREANALTPTPLAKSLARQAATMRAGADAIARLVDSHRDAPTRIVRVTATNTVTHFISAHFHEVAGQCRAAGAAVTLLPSRVQFDLGRREADIALRMAKLPEQGDMVMRRIGRIGFAVYALRDGGAPGVIGFADHERFRSQAQWLDDWAEARGLPVVLRCSEKAPRLAAALSGLGATLLPCVADADPRLVRVSPRAFLEDVYLLIHRDLRQVPAIRATAEAIAALFKTHARMLAGES